MNIYIFSQFWVRGNIIGLFMCDTLNDHLQKKIKKLRKDILPKICIYVIPGNLFSYAPYSRDYLL